MVHAEVQLEAIRGHAALATDARVVDEDMEWLVAREQRRGGRAHARQLAEVTRDRDDVLGVRAQRLDHRRRLVERAAEQPQPRATLRERLGHRPTDADVRAGDHHDAAFELSLHRAAP